MTDAGGELSHEAQDVYLPYCGTNQAYCELGMSEQDAAYALADFSNILDSSGLTSNYYSIQVPVMPWVTVEWTLQDTHCVEGYIGVVGAGVTIAMSGGALGPIVVAAILGGVAAARAWDDGCF